jgi:glycosyltransferase involved in cell wall biosynthesis
MIWCNAADKAGVPKTSMLSAIIATYESERTLVPTLAALVPGATGGLLGEVIVADGGSRDATAEVADIAGCRFVTSQAPLGARLKAAAASTRSPWLLFLRAGSVPEPGWIATAERFIEATDLLDGASRAAVFRPPGAADLLHPRLTELAALLRVIFGGGPKPEQGLLIARRFYDQIGGHPEGADAEAAILRRIGRRRIEMLPVAAGLTR